MNCNSLLTDLIEIIDGFTRFHFRGEALFFRHFDLKSQSLISNSYEKYKNIATKKGLESEDEIYKRLEQDKIWTQNDELEIETLQKYVENLKKTKEKIFLPSKQKAHQEIIDQEIIKLNSLLSKKNDLISVTSESYANKMSNEEFIRLLIFKDEELSQLRFSELEFGELDSSEIFEISNSYIEITKKFTEQNIQKIVLQDFFNIYLSYCEDAQAFFGKTIVKLSAYQMKLLIYGKIFNNIFQYNDDIPENLRKDPEAVFSFLDSKKKRNKFEESTKNADGTILFGATSQDVGILDPTAKKVSLQDELEKNGGSLNMEQMIKLMT